MFAERQVVRGAGEARARGRALAYAIVLGAAAMLSARRVAAQQLTGGLHLGGPVRASLAVGALFQARDADESRGVIALVEPGLRGGRVSVGYQVARGQLGTFVGARATLLRTWHVATPETFVGAELELLPLFAIGGRLGGFVPATGPRRLLWIADVSIGM